MQIPTASYRAGGTIAPSVGVMIDTGNDNQVVQATANAMIVGVSQEGQKGAPGVLGSDTTVAANSGDQIEVIGPGNVALIVASAAVTRGDLIEITTGGQALTSTASGTRYIAGVALESASGAGVKFKLLVLPIIKYS